MGDFFSAAFPWVALGIAVAVIITYMISNNKNKDKKK